jgi:hypothetical protein
VSVAEPPTPRQLSPDIRFTGPKERPTPDRMQIKMVVSPVRVRVSPSRPFGIRAVTGGPPSVSVLRAAPWLKISFDEAGQGRWLDG